MPTVSTDAARRCRLCGGTFPLGPAYFHRNHANREGFDARCKACVRDRSNARGGLPVSSRRASAEAPCCGVQEARAPCPLRAHEADRRLARLGYTVADLSFRASVVTKRLRSWLACLDELQPDELWRVEGALRTWEERREEEIERQKRADRSPVYPAPRAFR